MEEKTTIKTPATRQEYIDEIIKSYPSSIDSSQKIETGWETLSDLKSNEDPETLKEKIKATVKSAGKDLSSEMKKDLAKMLFNIFSKGISPKEAMGISQNELSEIYGFAFSLFSAGKYEDSMQLFKMLLTLDPSDSNFATSVGTCYHRLKDYEGALVYYLSAMSLNQTDPIPAFYAYDCFMNLNCEPWALVMLEYTIIRAGDQKPYELMVQKAVLLAEPLEKKVIDQFFKEN